MSSTSSESPRPPRRSGTSPDLQSPAYDDLAEVLGAEGFNLIRYELNAALIHFINKDRPVYLDGLGIVFPELRRALRSEVACERLIVREENFRTVSFEKCYDLESFPRDRFRNIVETRELAQRIYPRLPAPLASDLSEWKVRRIMRTAIDRIKRQVVIEGVSRDLSSIGSLYSLHNRQGTHFSEWFAGADIFVEPTFRQVLSSTVSTPRERPVLSSSWELLEAAYGEHERSLTLDLHEQLTTLGYDSSLIPFNDQAQVAIRVFRYHRDDGNLVELFCTEGLRHQGLLSGSAHGTELTFQALVGEHSGESAITPERAFTLAWILLQSARSKTLRAGLGLSTDTALFPMHTPEVKSIFITPFSPAPAEQLSREGPFRYMNVIGIFDDEAEMARHSSEHLRILLRRRTLEQITNPLRPSILVRTACAARTQRGRAHSTQATNTTLRMAV